MYGKWIRNISLTNVLRITKLKGNTLILLPSPFTSLLPRKNSCFTIRRVNKFETIRLFAGMEYCWGCDSYEEEKYHNRASNKCKDVIKNSLL